MFLAESAFHLPCVHIAKCDAGLAVLTRSSVWGVIVKCFFVCNIDV